MRIGMLLLATCAMSGCTLIGYGAGAGIDALNTRRVAPDSVAQFPLGTPLRVRFQDGALLRGRFAGLDSAVGPSGEVSRTLRLIEKRGHEPTGVPLHEVAQVERKSKSGRVSLAIVGGVLDVSVIVAMAVCAAQGGLMSC